MPTAPAQLSTTARRALLRAGAALAVLALAPAATHAETAMTTSLEAVQRRAAPFATRREYVVAPGREAEFVERAAVAARYAAGKDGPAFYRFFQNAEEPNRFVLFGEWAHGGAFAEHLEAAHAQAFADAVASLLVEPARTRVYRPAAEAAPGDGAADPALLAAQEPAKPTAAKTLERLERVGMGEVPFVLFVDIPVKEGGAGTMKKMAVRVQAATLLEPRSVKYGYYQDVDAPGSFLLLEWWESFAAMDRHVGLPHFADLMRAFGTVGGDGRTVGVYRPLPY
jgi:quinol monooxygenase YgiN